MFRRVGNSMCKSFVVRGNMVRGRVWELVVWLEWNWGCREMGRKNFLGYVKFYLF